MFTSSLRSAVFPAARSFSTSRVVRKDLIQDLYLNQLKSYKVPQKAANAHHGNVRTFNAPPSPQPPTLPTDLSSELSKFDASNPVFEAAKPKTKSVESTGEGEGAEEYLEFLEKDLPKAEAHH